MIDWNWFFSALAQSTAAIVGLLGAFIFTKILNNEQKYNENKERIQELITHSKYLKKKVKNRYFKWYNERMRENALDEIQDNANEAYEKSNEELYQEYNFSPFDNKDAIIKDIQELRTGD